MRILLVKPPLVKSSEVENIFEPLELLSLAGAVRDHEVRLCDLRIEHRGLEKTIVDFKPDLIGITCLIMDVPNVLSLAKQSKTLAPQAAIIVGGHHPTHCPEDFNRPFIDAIVLGIGEHALVELVNAIQGGKSLDDVPGLALPGATTVRFTPNRQHPATLDELAFPDRNVSGYHPKYYRLFGFRKLQSINTSRGCTGRCKFCLVWKEMKGACLHKSPARILAELQSISSDVPYVGFVDPHSFVDGDARMNELAAMIERAGIRKRYIMSLRASSIVRYPDAVARWAKLGLGAVSVGLESISDSRLTELRKGQSATVNEQALEILAKNNIHVVANFIIHQDFSLDDFRQLQEYVYEKRLQSLRFSILTPLPGSELWNEVGHLVRSRDYEHYDLLHSVLPTALPNERFHREVLNLYRRSYSWSHLWRVTKSHWAFRLGVSQRPVPKLLNVPMILYMKYKLSRIEKHHVAFKGDLPNRATVESRQEINQ